MGKFIQVRINFEKEVIDKLQQPISKSVNGILKIVYSMSDEDIEKYELSEYMED